MRLETRIGRLESVGSFLRLDAVQSTRYRTQIFAEIHDHTLMATLGGMGILETVQDASVSVSAALNEMTTAERRRTCVLICSIVAGLVVVCTGAFVVHTSL